MKTIMTLMLGLSLVIGSTVAFAQTDTTKTHKAKKLKKSKKSTDSTATTK